MALTPAEILALRADIGDLLDRIEEAYQHLAEVNPLAGIDPDNIDTDKLIDFVKDLELILKSITVKVDSLETGFSDLYKTLLDINSAINLQVVGYRTGVERLRSITKIAKELKDDQYGILELNKKQLQIRKEKLESDVSELLISKKLLENSGKLARYAYLYSRRGSLSRDERKELRDLKKIKILYDEINGSIGNSEDTVRRLQTLLNDRIESEERIERSIGITGRSMQLVEQILSRSTYSKYSEIFKEASERAKEFAKHNESIYQKQRRYKELLEASNTRALTVDEQDELDVTGRILEAGDQTISRITASSKILGGVVKGLAKEFTAAFDFLSLRFLFNTAVNYTKARYELSRAFSLGRDDANRLRDGITRSAVESGEMEVNIQDTQKALLEINKSLGTASKLSEGILTNYIKLTEYAGYDQEAVKGLVSQSIYLKDLDFQRAKILRGQILLHGIQNKTVINERDIFESIGKVSTTVLYNLRYSSKSLVEATYAAKALGMEIDDIYNSTRSLLNFGSSIEDELSTELLLQKNINLERIRYARLTGDVTTVTKEYNRLIREHGSELENNVLLQEKFASLLGKSPEEILKAVQQTKILDALQSRGIKSLEEAEMKYQEMKKKGYSEQRIAYELGSQALADQYKSADAQKRFSAAIEKLKDVLVKLVEGPLGRFLDRVADISEKLSESKTLLDGISKVLLAIAAIKFVNFTGLPRMFSKMTGGIPAPPGSTGVAGSAAAASRVVNPLTGRNVTVGGRAYNRMVQELTSRGMPIPGTAAPITGGGGGLMSLIKKIPLGKLLGGLGLSSIIEGFLLSSDVKDMLRDHSPENPIDPAKLYQKAGERVVQSLGTVAGGTLGAVFGGVPGAIIGSLGGGWLASVLSKQLGLEGLGKKAIKLLGGEPYQDLRKSGILPAAKGAYIPATPGGQLALVAEGGQDEIISPISDFYKFADRIINKTLLQKVNEPENKKPVESKYIPDISNLYRNIKQLFIQTSPQRNDKPKNEEPGESSYILDTSSLYKNIKQSFIQNSSLKDDKYIKQKPVEVKVTVQNLEQQRDFYNREQYSNKPVVLKDTKVEREVAKEVVKTKEDFKLDTSSLERKLDKLIEVITKGSDIYFDTEKVGNALRLGYYRTN